MKEDGMMAPEVEVELNPNDPSLHNGGDKRYKMMGFMNDEDYQAHCRRMGDRSKPAPTDMYKKKMSD